MEQIENTPRPHQCWFILIVTVYVLLVLSGCKKLLGVEELRFSGKIRDDITGAGIPVGGTIAVNGYNGNAAGLFDFGSKLGIGRGKINADGSFSVSFTKWEEATKYEFIFLYPNNAYINNGNIYLNTVRINSTYFSGGSYSMNFTAAKMTELAIDFKNMTPFSADDSLIIRLPQPGNNILFGYLMPRLENLQNCNAALSGWIRGGINASGTLRCKVPADRRFRIDWLTKKNGITRTFNDSISCPRDIITTYSLNY